MTVIQTVAGGGNSEPEVIDMTLPNGLYSITPSWSSTTSRTIVTGGQELSSPTTEFYVDGKRVIARVRTYASQGSYTYTVSNTNLKPMLQNKLNETPLKRLSNGNYRLWLSGAVYNSSSTNQRCLIVDITVSNNAITISSITGNIYSGGSANAWYINIAGIVKL